MKASRLEESLAFQLRAEGITDYETEVKFHPKRKWRADLFVKPDLLIEAEGGLYSGGRHVRGAAYEKDAEKYNAAVIMGYRVLRFGPSQIRSGEALDTIKQALGAENAL